MGVAKSELMEAEERGWWFDDDKFVCEDCVEDAYLKEVIRNNLMHAVCSYCGADGNENIAAPLQDLMVPIASAVAYHFNDPTMAGVPSDGGAFIIESRSTEDVLMSLPLDCHAGLFEDVAGAFVNSYWVSAADGHWLSSHDHELMSESWRIFVKTVCHETRFHFNLPDHSSGGRLDEMDASSTLPMIGRLISANGLLKQIAEGLTLFRVRARKPGDSWKLDAVQLGAPPPAQTTAGRMNPAGIPYLYLAFDEQTAIAETRCEVGAEVAVAEFVTTKSLTVVDLSELPGVPSVFDDSHRKMREAIFFLEDFVDQITQPVSRDGSEHIDYVPSQVVSEYMAQVFHPSANGNRVDGILYPSAAHPGGKNLVLFPSKRGMTRQFDSVTFVSAALKLIST